MADQLSPTTFPEKALKRTIIEHPKAKDDFSALSISLIMGGISQRITQWGPNPKFRDKQLRGFWPTEPYLAGAIFSACVRNANLQWEIDGPNDRLISALTDMLNGTLANENFGWLPFINTWSQDWYGQDNGAFIEIIRDDVKDVSSKFKGENAPVIGLAHLDSGNCRRTGDPVTPVIYTDRKQKDHKLKWYEVIPLAEFPSAMQTMNGVGFSAVSRILRMAEIIQSIQIYTDEKVSGRHVKELHFVGGVSRMDIEDIRKQHDEQADNQGLSRFVSNVIYASIDPEKPVTTASINLAALPDNFDFDTLMRWYIADVALATGMDYQDLAPLPSGNLGSGKQSEILHKKSRGKGPANFMEIFQNIMRNYGIIPKGYTFKFKVKDLAEEMERAEMEKTVIEKIVIARRADTINGTAARKAMELAKVFDPEVLALVPDDFGNEETLGQTENMLGQEGDSTIGEDAKRVTKEIVVVDEINKEI